MVDIGIASASSGTDALSLLRSGRSRNSDDDNSGFLDAMSNSGSDKAAIEDDDSDDDATTSEDSQLPDDGITSLKLTASGRGLDAATIPATAAATLANAPLFAKSLALPASSTLSGKIASTAAMPADTSQGSTTVAVAADGTAAAAATEEEATVADAMASLGVAAPTDAAMASPASGTATNVLPANGKAATQVLPATAMVSALVSSATTAQPQAASDSTTAIPVSSDTGAGVQTDLKTPNDMMQQLAAIVGDAGSAQPAVDGKVSTAVTPGKTSAASVDDDTKADTDTETNADVAADAAPTTSGAVTDALSLLNITAPAAAQVQAQATSTLTGPGQAAALSGKSQVSISSSSASTVGSSRSKTSAVAADALDTSATADSEDTGAAIPGSLAALRASATAGSKSGTTTTADDSSTATFRIARADSKVQALDMAISKNTDDTTQADVQTASGTGTETVTVLDSRRYLGLADGSNSALVANALSGNKEWSSTMRAGSTAATSGIAGNTSKVVNTLKIQMNPEKLGTVTATMRLSGDSLSVDLKVQSGEAYRQLSNDQGPMIDSLRAQGYKVDNITVTYAPQPTADSSQQQNSQAGFQGQQQSGASQGQGGEAQSRRQNSGQRTGDQDGNWGTQNVGSDDSVAGNAQRTRSSGVYL